MDMSEKRQKDFVGFINCLSILESQTSLLYGDIAAKVASPLVRALLEEIAFDSQKHSALLKGVSESITHQKKGQKECEKQNSILQNVFELQKEISKMQKITSEDLLKLNENLQLLEAQMGEEYYVFVQMRTLTMMTNQINQNYNIDLSNVKRIFTTIINDEERHTELLETVKKMSAPEEQSSNTPMVKFQNPDAWYQSPPSAL
jgi:rubrerythrin